MNKSLLKTRSILERFLLKRPNKLYYSTINEQPTKKDKCCNVKPLFDTGEVVEYGQPIGRTHPHLFASSALTDQVTPGITRQEYAQRRDVYVQRLLHYHHTYFGAKLSAQEKHQRMVELLHHKASLPSADSSTSPLNFIAVIPSSQVAFMAPDVPYQFRQNSDFLYLTGFKEPNSCLVISRTDNDKSYKTALFVREKDPQREIWEGPCTGSGNIRALFGIENAYPLDDIKIYLTTLMRESAKSVALWRYPSEHVFKHESGPNCVNEWLEQQLDEFVDEQAHTSARLVDMRAQEDVDARASAGWCNTSRHFVQVARAVKSPAEIELMRKACEISSEAFRQSMRISHPYISESLVYAKFDFECRIRGADYLAYIPVIAGGPRATILHYIRNDQLVRHDRMLLMDAGCQYRDYVSDITRTWPVTGGLYKGANRELYEACLNVQLSCLRAASQPGMTLNQLYMIMLRELAIELGKVSGLLNEKHHGEIIKVAREPQVSHFSPGFFKAIKRYCPHDIGHYLGLDVHDCPEASRVMPLVPGTVITIEPGIYIPPNDETVPPRYRGIGIRIEDDVAITSDGYDVLSKKCPKTMDEIEKLFS